MNILPEINYQKLFESISGLYLILDPKFIIIQATNDYLSTSMRKRENILGKYLFDEFHDNPNSTNSSGPKNLINSLNKVLIEKISDVMDIFNYDIILANGDFEVKYWKTENSPILDKNGNVEYIIHKTEDITEFILLKNQEIKFNNELKIKSDLENVANELAKSEIKYRKLFESLEIEVEKRTIQLTSEQEKLTSLLMNAPAIIAILNGDKHTFEFSNPKYSQVFGNRQLVGLPIREALPDLEGQIFFDLLDNVYKTGIPYIGNEIPVSIDKYRNGIVEDVYFNFVYQPILNKNKNVTGITIFAFDITEQVISRRRVEELNQELIKSEAEYKSLSELLEIKVEERTKELSRANKEIEYQINKLNDVLINAPAAICLLEGEQHTFSLTNSLYENLFGHNLVGKTVREALPLFDGQGYFEILDQVYQTGKPFIGKESYATFGNDENGILKEYYFDFVYQRILNKNNQATGISAFVYDVTDVVISRHQIEKLNRNLKRSNDELKSFAYIASHDLQEPLRTINSYSELISRRYKDNLDEKAKDFLSLIISASKRMKFLIENILDHSKIERTEENNVSNINEVMENLKLNMTTSIQETNTTLIYQNLPFVKTEYQYMVQLFQNLISNSIKYRKKNIDPIIIISAIKDNDFYVFSVKDNGIGISEKYHKQIFEIFKRLHNRDEYEGTGIGLASCKKIVEIYGGNIWIESAEGDGTNVLFTLPV